MKANSFDHNYDVRAKSKPVETMPLRIEEVNSFVEEHEDAIADGEEITIRIERIEGIIAPAPAASHHQARGSDSK